LDGEQIHEAIGVAQEGLHGIKTKQIKGVVVKIDMSKSCDRFNWLFIHLLLTHLGFEVPFINWVMGCISSTSFAVLLNESNSPFLHTERGLWQGFPLSPMLSLLVDEGLSCALADEKSRGIFPGIPITHTLVLIHLLFEDDVLIFYNGQRDDVETLSDVFSLFSRATGMHINVRKYTLPVSNMSEEETNFYKLHLSFEVKDFDLGLKYLGFQLKPNCYLKSNWSWLITKLEKRLKQWSHGWLSHAGRLVLVKLVLEDIHVYWMSLA
jgi:hypothetical protein